MLWYFVATVGVPDCHVLWWRKEPVASFKENRVLQSSSATRQGYGMLEADVCCLADTVIQLLTNKKLARAGGNLALLKNPACLTLASMVMHKNSLLVWSK